MHTDGCCIVWPAAPAIMHLRSQVWLGRVLTWKTLEWAGLGLVVA